MSLEKYIKIVERVNIDDPGSYKVPEPIRNLGDGFETVNHNGQKGIKDTQTGKLILMSTKLPNVFNIVTVQDGREVTEYGLSFNELGPATQKALQKIGAGGVQETYESSEQVRSIVQRMMEDARVPQKPRQGPLRPQTGAGKHKDKKKDQKQGKEKHKKPFMEQGVAESDYSPMTKDSMKADKILSLKNLIAKYKEQGRQLKVQELELELKKLQGVAEGSGKNVVKSVKVGNFRHDLVDTGFGWQVRIYNGDELYDTGLSKNSEQKGLAALDDAVAYTKKQLNIKEQGVAEGSSYETDSMVSHISQIIGNIYPQGGDKNTYMKLVAREMRPIVQSNPKLFRRAFGIAYDRFFHIDQDDDNDNDYTDYSMRQGERGMAEGDDWGNMSKREFKRREMEHELGHEVEPRREKPRGMYFYNVPSMDLFKAKSMGLKQSRSGKWYSTRPNPQADLEFGKGKYWEPKETRDPSGGEGYFEAIQRDLKLPDSYYLQLSSGAKSDLKNLYIKYILESVSGVKKHTLETVSYPELKNIARMIEEKQKGVDGKACWKGYKRMGTKKKGRRTVDNCVKAESLQEKSPPGFKGTVKAMKKHPELTKGKTKDGKEKNPWALAWHMKNKGYKSHKKADGSDKD